MIDFSSSENGAAIRFLKKNSKANRMTSAFAVVKFLMNMFVFVMSAAVAILFPNILTIVLAITVTLSALMPLGCAMLFERVFRKDMMEDM